MDIMIKSAKRQCTHVLAGLFDPLVQYAVTGRTKVGGQRHADAATARSSADHWENDTWRPRILMPKFAAILPTPETTGDFEEMCLAAGECAALVTTIGSAQAIVQTIAQEAEQILEQQRTAVGSIHRK